MNWTLVFLPEAEKDLRQLSGNQRVLVRKAIKKVQTDLLPTNEGGYGKPLGNRSGTDLSGFLKIKLREAGLRVVYKLVQTDSEMLIVVIGARADDKVYETAACRAKKHGL
jgi:mRNA interferase RelE/StbE